VSTSEKKIGRNLFMVGATGRLGAPVLVSIKSIQAGIWIAPFLDGILAPKSPFLTTAPK
jgi:hypothetical protein